METTSTSEQMLIQWASFLSNLFHGNSALSSFQLEREYSPFILCIPSSIVPPGLLQTRKQTAASRPVNKLLRSRLNSVLSHELLPPGTEVWIYYYTSKQNKPKGWVKGAAEEAFPYHILGNKTKKGSQ